MKKISLLLLVGFFSMNLPAQHNYDNQSVIYSDNGNVGIGTTSPESKLEVKSSNNLKTFLNRNGQSAISFIPNNGNSWFHISHGLNNDLHFSHGGTVGAVKMMTMKNNGNVGIGIISPNEKLEVNGNIKGPDGESYIKGYKNIIGRSTDGILHLRAGTNNGPIFLNYYESGNVVLAKGGGNVGIGTTLPGSKFEVKSDNGLKTFLNRDDQSAISFIPNNGNSWFHISHGLDNDLHFSHGGTVGAVKMMTIKNNGNVGIGTTTPSKELEVNGTIKTKRLDLENTHASYLDGNHKSHFLQYNRLSVGLKSTDNYFTIEDWDGDTYVSPLLTVQQTGQVNFYSGGQNRMHINQNGNVGIGTTNPDAKLTVKGDIHTQEVRVDLNGAVAPDFVFEPDYKLRTLTATEKYIKENKHLPEIPSASEMGQNGLELKAMNLKLLQKVEELTLYVIDLQKQVSKLKQQTKNK